MAAKEIFISEKQESKINLFVLAVQDKKLFITEQEAIGIIQSLSSQLMLKNV